MSEHAFGSAIVEDDAGRYADNGGDSAGADRRGPGGAAQMGAGGPAPGVSGAGVGVPYGHPPPPESVAGEDVRAGGSNATGGVVRRARRGFSGRVGSRTGAAVVRSYNVAGGIQFNNLSELYQDAISPEYAQEIIETVLVSLWLVPLDQPRATKYAEDLIFAFIVAVSASDKADWGYAYPLPLDKGETEANFKDFSDYLMRDCKITRRQFARGVADRVWKYLGDDDNAHLLDDVATKVGCDRQMSSLAFDGSTHCKGMTPRQVQFTKTLESRNLFERDDEIARGASDRLMGSIAFTGQPRAVR